MTEQLPVFNGWYQWYTDKDHHMSIFGQAKREYLASDFRVSLIVETVLAASAFHRYDGSSISIRPYLILWVSAKGGFWLLHDHLAGLQCIPNELCDAAKVDMRQAFLSIPRDYNDAATNDSANLWQIWWKVLMPQVQATMATLTVLRLWATRILSSTQ